MIKVYFVRVDGKNVMLEECGRLFPSTSEAREYYKEYYNATKIELGYEQRDEE